jgi:tRNA (adenine22-N1)-methyltransferase
MANNSMARLINKTIWDFGPIIMEKEQDLLKQLLNNEVERLRKAAAEMQYTERKEVAEKAKEICDEIKLLEVIKQCRFQ